MGDAWKENRSGNNRRQPYRGNQKHPNADKGGGDRGGSGSYRRGNVTNVGRGLGFNTPSYGEGMTFPLTIKPGSKAYRKYVEIAFNFKKDGHPITKDITDTRNDIRKRTLCYQCMYVASINAGTFNGAEYTYDNMHILYTSKPIENFTYTFNNADLPADLLACLGSTTGELVMTVQESESGDVVDLCDLSQYETDTILLQEDHSLRTALEMIINDTTLATGDFTLARGNDLYHVKEEPIDRGLCTRLGTKKGVRIIKKNGEYLPALVVDIVHSPFYASANVTTFLDLVLKFVGNPRTADWEEAARFFNGIKVYPRYAQQRVLQCNGFTPLTVQNIKISLDSGKNVSMAQFYKSEKGITLNRLDVPAMIAKNDAGDFPLEALYVVPSQLVDLENCPNHMRDEVHRRNAILPKHRYDEIVKEVKAMLINGTIGSAFGIDSTTPIENVSHLVFELPSKPKIQLGGGQVITPDEDGRFNLGRGRYLQPAVINRMALLTTQDDLDMAEAFLERFVECGQSRGMRFQSINSIGTETLVKPNNFAEWEELFDNFNKSGVTFVLLVGTVRNPNLHHFLKLCESQYKIVTQFVTSEVARRPKNQHITIANILHKTNVKNGGLNYKPLFDGVGERLDINKGNVLVIAYDVSHPGELDSALPQNHREAQATGKFPSVVGLVANVISEPSAFVGNFFFQQSRKEEVIAPVFGTYIKKMLTQLVKSGRSLPSTVTILRDGVSEGQFAMVVRDELPLIKKACTEIKPSWKPKFLVAIVTKRHHKRFVNDNLTNAPVGAFVTDKVVRPDCVEFFMACHKAIKGTTKFVQVSIIHNELKATTAELKPFLHSLSYGHQIVTSPVSLPTPVYQADDMATRGREVLQTLRHEKPRDIPMNDDGDVDFEALSKLLSYFDSPLAAKRCNA